MPRKLLPHHGEVLIVEDIAGLPDCQVMFEKLMKVTPWKQQSVRLFGKWIPQPRLTAWYGDEGVSYKYSGLLLEPLKWTPLLANIKKAIEQITGTEFNSALINQYRNGSDYMGWHRDNERALGPEPIIASYSLGATRTFQLREYNGGSGLISIVLHPGTLLVMKGETQQYWEHRLPKDRKVDTPRINITFRNVIAGDRK